MVLGIIGHGMVGGTLSRWLKENTSHEVRIYDPPKGHLDFLQECEAIFISVPVPDSPTGQDLKILKESIELAKQHTDKVFVRSSVLPDTNDQLGTISMPEFFTARVAYDDMCRLPILVGETDLEFVERIFPNKKILMMKNKECELAKMAHNCFGAMKVTYFNIIYHLCENMGINYEDVLKGAMITGFIEKQHTTIALDGQYGYGGPCLPTNIKAMIGFLKNFDEERFFFSQIDELNSKYRFGLGENF